MQALKEKIVLGTVQLGIPYGINNASGKPSQTEAFAILDSAYDHGIRILDTADGYGEALKVIGDHNRATRRSFRIINKFKSDDTPLHQKLENSLKLLNATSLYCYMYHQVSDYAAGIEKKNLAELKGRGLIQNVGLSLYSTEELEIVINDADINIIQLPVNILDFGAKKRKLIDQARKAGKEIHARSVYLQGLFFKDADTFSGNIQPLKQYVERLDRICKANNMSVRTSALNFVLHQDCIDRVLLGIEQADQIKENLDSIMPSFDSSVFESLRVKAEDAHLLNPVNWRL